MTETGALVCPRCSGRLKSTLSSNSVILDVCVNCKGVWFDKGEINFFVKNRQALQDYYNKGLTDKKPSLLICPKCRSNLNSGKIPGFRYEVEECPRCFGLLLDEHEFKKIGRLSTTEAKPIRSNYYIPSLGFTSLLVLGSLYAILFAFVVFLVETQKISFHQGAAALIITVALQFVLGPIAMDWSLRLWGSLQWVSLEDLPQPVRDFLKDICTKNKIPMPKIGIINDGAPQAYTYGRTPASARLVLSRGIVELLDEDEVQCVIAHEIGHIVHWDFVVMTIAQLVPLVFYHIYRTCLDLSKNKRGCNLPGKSRSKKGSGQLVIAGFIAYIAYYVSHYLVMFISRVREYWADRFSIESTRNPNGLVSALTKIGYGMTGRTDLVEGEMQENPSVEKKMMAVQPLGIMNLTSSKELQLIRAQGLDLNPQALKEVMRWDLWNPWAAYYELHSTHPLIAKRINAISQHAVAMGIQPDIVFDLKQTESYWDDFLRDLAINLLPYLGALGFLWIKLSYFTDEGWQKISDPFHVVLPLVIGFAAGSLVRTYESYPRGFFLQTTILSLLKKLKVSPVKAYPVTVKGKIIGRGEPGRIFSEDLVIKDETGMIFLDYEQPLALLNWLFALLKVREYEGQEVEVEGWYRRAPIPFIEVKRIWNRSSSCSVHTYFYKMFFWSIVLVLGLFIQYNIR